MGKIIAAAPATIPIRIDQEDTGSITLTEEINKSIKSTARSMPKWSNSFCHGYLNMEIKETHESARCPLIFWKEWHDKHKISWI